MRQVLSDTLVGFLLVVAGITAAGFLAECSTTTLAIGLAQLPRVGLLAGLGRDALAADYYQTVAYIVWTYLCTMPFVRFYRGREDEYATTPDDPYSTR